MARKKTIVKVLTKARTKGDVSHVDVVTLAVFLSGGDKRAVDTEDVAVKAHKMAPGRFSWRKYDDQINLEMVRVCLSNAKKPQYGHLVNGSGKRGWILTPSGLSWSKKNARRLLSTKLEWKRERSKTGSVDENRWRRERARIVATSAWKQWQTKAVQQITVQEAAEVFRIDSYAVGEIRATKVMRVTALFSEDKEIGPFLAEMAQLIEAHKRAI